MSELGKIEELLNVRHSIVNTLINPATVSTFGIGNVTPKKVFVSGIRGRQEYFYDTEQENTYQVLTSGYNLQNPLPVVTALEKIYETLPSQSLENLIKSENRRELYGNANFNFEHAYSRLHRHLTDDQLREYVKQQELSKNWNNRFAKVADAYKFTMYVDKEEYYYAAMKKYTHYELFKLLVSDPWRKATAELTDNISCVR